MSFGINREHCFYLRFSERPTGFMVLEQSVMIIIKSGVIDYTKSITPTIRLAIEH